MFSYNGRLCCSENESITQVKNNDSLKHDVEGIKQAKGDILKIKQFRKKTILSKISDFMN